MTEKEKEEAKFEKWFWRVVDRHLVDSLEQWQLQELKRLCLKAYKKKS